MQETEQVDTYSYGMVVAYDGRGYFGWQRLADKPTIQAILESAIKSVCDESVVIQGSGRTDRGVHAEGQVAGFKLTSHRDPEELGHALNEQLPETIRIVEVGEVDASFHARMSAIGKEYAYLIWNEPEIPDEMKGRAWHVEAPLNVEAMATAAEFLVGDHDFASFATKTGFKQKSTRRIVTDAIVEQCDEVVRFRFQANGFLNHMVRNMVKALVKVGDGRHQPEKIQEILEAKNRSAAPGTAPPSGLYLIEVFYE